jgi:hypothetical protein
MTEPKARSGPVEIAGMWLVFEIDGVIVKVTDSETGDWVGNAHYFSRDEGPLLHPSLAYSERLGTSAADLHGADQRGQIAKHAKEFRDATTKEG